MTEKDITENRYLAEFNKRVKVVDPIFKNRAILSTEYLPENIIGRDTEINSILSNWQPILGQTAPFNIFLNGDNGVGKTISVKYAYNIFDAGLIAMSEDHLELVEINCSKRNDIDIIQHILAHFNIYTNAKGISISANLKKIFDIINEKAKKYSHYTVLFFFDEIDKLNQINKKSIITDGSNIEILYQFTRPREFGFITATNVDIGIIVASNIPEYIDYIPKHISTKASFCGLNFPAYDKEKLKLIMLDRIDAFNPEVINNEIIDFIAEEVADRHNGDARRALDTLLYAGKCANDSNCNKITFDHILQADEILNTLDLKEIVSKYSKHDKYMLISIDLCNEYVSYPEMNMVYEVYSWLCKSCLNDKPNVYGHATRTATMLISRRLVESDKGSYGNSRTIRLTKKLHASLPTIIEADLQEKIDKNKHDLELIARKYKRLTLGDY